DMRRDHTYVLFVEPACLRDHRPSQMWHLRGDVDRQPIAFGFDEKRVPLDRGYGDPLVLDTCAYDVVGAGEYVVGRVVTYACGDVVAESLELEWRVAGERRLRVAHDRQRFEVDVDHLESIGSGRGRRRNDQRDLFADEPHAVG